MEKHNDQNRFHLYLRGIILVGFTLLMLKLVLTGNMTNFIAPKMLPFIYFAMVVFLLLGVMQIWRSGSKKEAELSCNCGVDHSSSQFPFRSFFVYLVFIIPIITGFLFPEVVLDSSVAAKRGFKSMTADEEQSIEKKGGSTEKAEAYLNDPEAYMEELDERVGDKVANSSNLPDVPLEHPEGFELQAPPEDYYQHLENEMLKKDTITLTEENYIAMTSILDENPEKFVGKTVEIMGFVYREDNFKEDQFVIARFGLSCCVADASVYGTLATFHEAKQYGDDQWIKIKGTLTTIKYQDWTLPYVKVTTVETVEQPDEPYVYESY
ncbi:TIGR03943 family putative permease subunit [Metabacillus bambusae]|uniref:TIGR03943 family protein n=1 Tax=Metabacillus bambusae TaxID=2795218 RepID=A0ABS3N4X2_9BACI|nr:TIGR03943 family protein [Metabacillus bambusae]MBO1513131.1 TIGR03943 family protein [Metabacillus bambusae]